MSKVTSIQVTGQAIVGSGRLLAVVVCSHSSGTLALNDQPQAGNLGAQVLGTYTFAAGSQTIQMFGKEFYQGLFATVGGTGVSIELVTTPDMGGIIN